MFQAILEVQENLRSEPTAAGVAEAMNMPVQRLRRLRDVGRAARNKLIKVSNKTATDHSVLTVTIDKNQLKFGVSS